MLSLRAVRLALVLVFVGPALASANITPAAKAVIPVGPNADTALIVVRVGDTATLVQELDDHGSISTISRAVQEIVSYDATKKTYTARVTTTAAGANSSTVETQLISAEELSAPEEMLKNCEKRNGKRETTRVMDQGFATCKVSAGDPETSHPLTVWFAAVPFGLVRSEMQVGKDQKVSTRMESYRFGSSALARR